CFELRMAQYFDMRAGTVYVAIVASVLGTMALADAPSGGAPNELDNDIALILDNPLPETTYSEKRRCLNTRTYRSVEVLDASHLLFWGRSGRVWLNQLRSPCIGLTKDKILQFDTTGSSLCELDRFRGLDRSVYSMPVAFCGLQRFEVISEEQANRLRDALQRRAHTAAQVPKPPPEPKGE
ncbi:MAG: DUF6491 family protein, partial [Gammaproteobacteria bacterium]